MNVLRILQGLVLPSHQGALVAWFCLAVVARPLAADSHVDVPAVPIGDRASASVSASPRPGFPKPVGDVALRSGGVLEGQVLYRDGTLDVPRAALSVALLDGRETVARTRTDPDGRFAFRDVRGGLYRVVIDTRDGRFWQFYRLWTAEGAPPDALGRIDVVLGRRLVRGQSPIPGGRFPQAAVITAIAAGAIAAPIIHQVVKRDDHIPASP